MGARNRKALLEEDILEANEHTDTAAAAARYLDVHVNTYKRYAKMYGHYLSQINPGAGDHTKQSFGNAVYAYNDILAGEYPEYPAVRVKERGLKNGHFDHKCENCGFNERRITDGKSPFFLNYKNGDHTDHRDQNLEILCWNCAFLLVGDDVVEVLEEQALMVKGNELS